MGAFDDLVPANAATPSTAAPVPTGGAFADLIPARPQIGALESLSRGVEHGVTFGLAPAIRGAQEASAIPDVGDFMGIPLNAIAGTGRLLSDWALGHPDPSVRESYERGRQAALSSEKLAEEQHPYAYMGGVLAGSLAAPGFGAARGAGALGRIGYGMASGAAGAGAYGLGESISQERSLPQTAQAVGTDVGLGAGLGAAGSAGLELLNPMVKGAASLVRAIRDPEAEASRMAVGANLADEASAKAGVWAPLTPEEISAAHAVGTPLANLDVMGPQTRALAEWSASMSPVAEKALRELGDKRLEGQAPRIAQFIQNMTGGGDLASDVERIEDAARKANAGTYKVAYANGQDGMWSPELERLTGSPAVRDAMKGAVERGQDRAIRDGLGAFNPGVTFDNGVLKFGQGKGVPAYPDQQFWDYTQRELRNAAGQAARAGRNEEASTLFGLHRALNGELDRMNPAFQNARQGAAQFFGADNALDAGAAFVNARSNMQMGQARQAFNKMTPDQQDLFARGYATELATRLTGTGDTRNVLNSVFLNNPNARARTEMALGSDNARQLEAALRVERLADQARGLYLGSPTAKRTALQTTIGVGAGLTEYLSDPHSSLASALETGLAFGSPLFLAGRGKQILNQRVAGQLGRMLASDDPAVFAKGIDLVSKNPTAFNALRQATGTGARIGAEAIEESGQKRAHGGSVTGRPIQPPLRGARKGKDGRWYIGDKSRPGKYLRVDMK